MAGATGNNNYNDYWFHISTKFIGNNPIFIPKAPDTATKKEGNIPRICVSNSIYECLRSVCGIKHPTVRDLLFSFPFCFKLNTSKLFLSQNSWCLRIHIQGFVCCVYDHPWFCARWFFDVFHQGVIYGNLGGFGGFAVISSEVRRLQ